MKSFRNCFLIILIPVIFFSGCGVWENFTTYFNLYFNTKDAFEKAEKDIYAQKRELFATTDLQVTGTAGQLLAKVIEKASKILQFSPNSAYVDDALLMLGKSFYYQKNYLKGLRKFQELIATQPESDLIIETRLWIGKSQMKLKEYDNALATLRAVRDTAIVEDETEIIKDAFVEEIVYHISYENYGEAINVTKQFLEINDDDEITAELYYQLGKLYTEIDDIPNAIEAYSQVNNFSPTYEIELRSNIELAKSLRESGKPAEALNILESMGSQNKFSEAFAEIDVETGITLISLERFDEATDLLVYVDTTYAGTPHSGTAKFKLAELYEYHYKNFDSAAAYYQKNISGTAPVEILLASSNKTQKFRKYTALLTSLNDNKKKLEYIINPEIFEQDSIQYLLDSAEAAVELEALTEVTDLPEDDPNRTNRRNPPSNQNQLQQQKLLQLKKPVRPIISADSAKSLIVKNEFELANLFFTEFDLPDSAFYYYNDIITNYDDSVYYARVLFGLGSYYETINEKAKADSIYNVIYENYRNEQIVNAAAAKLGKPLVDLEFDPAKDLYVEAEELINNEKYNESLKKLNSIYENYPASRFAAKALYATGWILENQLSLFDSAAVVYDSLASQYPGTEYASSVKPKLEFYKTKQKAVRDSIAALKAAEDSLKNSMLLQDSLKTPVQPVQTPVNQQVVSDSLDSMNTVSDSIEQMHQSILDSLQRKPESSADSLQKDLKQQIDSLPPKRSVPE